MTNISKEILVYHNVPHSKYRWISYFSLFYMSIITFNLFFLATPKLMKERERAIKNKYRRRELKPDEIGTEAEINRWELNPDYEPDTLWVRMKNSLNRDILTWQNFKSNLIERPYLSAGVISASGLIVGAFVFYANRMVHRIVLIPNDRVRFQLFNPFPFGKPLQLEVNLNDVSCNSGRKASQNYSTLRIRDKWGYYLVHKSEGEFLEPKMYDRYLGYQRSWALNKQD